MSRNSNNQSSSSRPQYSTRNLAVPSSHQDSLESVPVQHAESTPGLTAADRLREYSSSRGRTKSTIQSEVADPEEAMLIQRLALQAYHIPGNSWSQDWNQFMLNNHPVLGMIFHHPKHPIKACTRFVALIGTVVVGLAITNLFYLFYVWNPKFNQPLVKVVVEDKEKTTLTTGMLLLWTLGSSCHATYNLLQWHIAACACCRTGGMCEKQACCPSLGKHLLRVLVIVVISMAILIILTRVAITELEGQRDSQVRAYNSTNTAAGEDDSIHFFDDDGLKLDVHDVSEFEFLVGYLVEMVLALFVYYPIGGTILFSGCLGCGRFPFLGGRPYEVRMEERKLSRMQQVGHAVTEEDTSEDIEEGDGAVAVQHFRAPRF